MHPRHSFFSNIIPAPYLKKYGKRPGLVVFVDGVTAAAIGAIAGAVLVLRQRTICENGSIPDLPKVVLLPIAIGLLIKFKKIP